MRYLNARFRRDVEQTAYRTYVTDGLRELAGGEVWQRWYDVAHPKTTTDTRSGVQIKAEIQERLKRM